MNIKLHGIVIDVPNMEKTPAFYEKLLGWKRLFEDDEWTQIGDESGTHSVGFQADLDYVAPSWPEATEGHGQMMHLDFLVDDLDKAVERALSLGAAKAKAQFMGDHGMTLLDPDGHPFCLVTG